MYRLILCSLALTGILAAGCGKSNPILGDGSGGGGMVDILVPKADIRAGTKLDVKTMFVAKPFPKESVPLKTVNDPVKLQGKVVARSLTAGVPIQERDLASENMGIMRELEPGYRAVGVRLDLEHAASGFLMPGSRVDLISTIRDAKDWQKSEARIVLQNIKVLAVNEQVEPSEPPMPFAGDKPVFVTLMLRPRDAERLALEASLGRLSLIIRKPGDTMKAETRGATPADRQLEDQ